PSSTGQRNVAFQVMQAKLKSNPDLKGVFGINDDSALGALRAVEQTERDIVIIGYDATPEARERIKADTALKADVVQSPKSIGEKTIEAIAQHLAGTAPPKVIPVGVSVVDRESLK
ncbi:MAG: substrate-binding domain-containing protein, partial [Planctomycetota bacterium]